MTSLKEESSLKNTKFNVQTYVESRFPLNSNLPGEEYDDIFRKRDNSTKMLVVF